MELVIPAITLLAAIGLTYLFCIRPMRTGRPCGMCPPGSMHSAHDKATTEVTVEDLQAARDKLAALRADLVPGDCLTPVSEATRGRTSVSPPAGGSPAGQAR